MPTGKLYKRGDKWYLDIHTGRKIDGKYERIQRKCQSRTKVEAQAELDELLYTMRRARRDGKALNNAYPVDAVCTEWCEHIKRTIKDPMLSAEYCRHAERMKDAAGVEAVSDLTLDLIEKALIAIAETKSTNTANKALAKFKAALEYAKENGRIASNPIARARQLRIIRKTFRRALTEDEVRMLLETAPEPWRTIWHFILSTGVRRDEIIHLRRADLDIKRGRVRIAERTDFKPKTQAGARTIPLGSKIRAALEALPTNGELLFTYNGKRLSANWMLEMFRRHIEEALKRLATACRQHGKPLPDNVTETDGGFAVDTAPLDLHAMRYTFITELIGAGVDPKTVQYLAGHKDIKTTLAIYAQFKGGNIDEAITCLPW